jgi:hypothetical protein
MVRLLWLLLALLMETAPENDEPEDDADEPDDGEEEVRDPEKQALSREAGRWRQKFRAAESRIAELEAGGEAKEALRSSRLESAFLRAVLAHNGPLDVETTWDLANVRGFLDAVTIDTDGNVDGMDEALARVLDRYPWLADEPVGDVGDGSPARRTAPPPKKKKDGAAEQHSRASLEARFPALRRHSR